MNSCDNQQQLHYTPIYTSLEYLTRLLGWQSRFELGPSFLHLDHPFNPETQFLLGLAEYDGIFIELLHFGASPKESERKEKRAGVRYPKSVLFVMLLDCKLLFCRQDLGHDVIMTREEQKTQRYSCGGSF
mmetsp:Transcript_11766/g.27262  ORF Transcript_11766/g.27262 Transcript_11766/m.27262 type:complete len:130 (+) Transcript_11766:154-543(+)